MELDGDTKFYGGLFCLVLQGFRIHVDKHSDPSVMYRGQWSRSHPESQFPDLERRYYRETLNQRFSEKDEEVAKDVERRHLLKKVISIRLI